MRPASGHNQTIFTKYIVKTGNPRYLGKKNNTKLFTKFTKHLRGKLLSFETEIDVQACNVTYGGWYLILVREESERPWKLG